MGGDNVYIYRLWGNLKYEEVYFHASETVSDVQLADSTLPDLPISSGYIARLTDAHPIECSGLVYNVASPIPMSNIQILSRFAEREGGDCVSEQSVDLAS